MRIMEEKMPLGSLYGILTKMEGADSVDGAKIDNAKTLGIKKIEEQPEEQPIEDLFKYLDKMKEKESVKAVSGVMREIDENERKRRVHDMFIIGGAIVGVLSVIGVGTYNEYKSSKENRKEQEQITERIESIVGSLESSEQYLQQLEEVLKIKTDAQKGLYSMRSEVWKAVDPEVMGLVDILYGHYISSRMIGNIDPHNYPGEESPLLVSSPRGSYALSFSGDERTGLTLILTSPNDKEGNEDGGSKTFRDWNGDGLNRFDKETMPAWKENRKRYKRELEKATNQIIRLNTGRSPSRYRFPHI